MVRFTVLASGSKGNSAVVTSVSGTSGSTRILVDAGLSCRELFRRMRAAGEDPEALDAIVITHEHQDHVNGLAVTARRLGIPVYFTEATHRAWTRQVTPQRRISYAEWLAQYRASQKNAPEYAASHPPHPDPEPGPDPAPDNDPVPDHDPVPDPLPSPEPTASVCTPASRAAEDSISSDRIPFDRIPFDPARLPAVNYFRAGERFSIGNVQVDAFTIPHDAADPVGFVFTAENVRLAVATDLGYMPPNVKAQLRRCDLILLESNHDLEMLRDGPYPWSVKQRVLSRVGHLSNDACASYFEQDYDGHATYLILGHLSESNNMPELARIAAERALCSHPTLLGNHLHLAQQHEPMEAVCF
jgi:phosphoribosyl 1,2-cyclic phosphodiesterase